jgi:putative membrane protein
MIRLALASTVLSLSLSISATAPAQPANPAPVAADPMDFVIKTAQSDEFEIREGKLATSKAANSLARAFAGQMIHDHTLSSQDLQEAVRRAGLPSPPPPSLSPGQARMLSDLETKTGVSFDHTYADQQVIAHRQAESLLQDFSEHGPPGPLRDFAAHTLPTVQHHLGTAMKLAAELETAPN